MSGYKNIPILHLSCRTSDLQFSLILQTHALVLESICNKEHKGIICNLITRVILPEALVLWDECFGKNITIHHERPCRIEISHPRGRKFNQGRGLPRPWLNSDPEGEISLSYMDRLMMDRFSPTFPRVFVRT